jgi:dipeptidyl aminopeptidase/acylaminoacyl peptidase
MQWSPDGRTIYYLPTFVQAPEASGVAALGLTSGETRMLATAPNTSLHPLRMSADGRFLFYVSEINASQSSPTRRGYSIFRLSTAGGEPEVLVEAASAIFAISPDARVLAWQRFTSSTDSIFVRDLLTGATRHVAAAGFPFSISPDHATLLHVHGPGLGLVTTTSLVTGATSTVDSGGVRDVRWGASGMELLTTDLGRILIMRGSGAPLTLWKPPPEIGGLVVVYAATWSPDGTRVAASVSEFCFATPCRKQLLLIDVASGSATILADRAGDSFGKPLFSADGRSVAVTTGGRLHVIRLP